LNGRPTNKIAGNLNQATIMTPPKDPELKIRLILEAARAVLSTQGYAGTTINLVATKAGVSRGLLHYYFKNKEEMLARVLEANMETSIVLSQNIFRQSTCAKDLSNSFIEALRHVVKEDPAFFHLFFEGWAVARQSQLIDQRLKSIYGLFRQTVYQGLIEASRQGVIRPSLSLKGLAALITGIMDGMGLQLVTEPDLADNEEVWDMAKEGLRNLLGN
jgi:AcrR family transcriptional regulator